MSKTLPPLPEPRIMPTSWGYDDKQMQAYAIEALEQQRQIEAQGVPDLRAIVSVACKDAQIIRNQALEDAAVLFPQPHCEYFGREIQAAIRAMKKESL